MQPPWEGGLPFMTLLGLYGCFSCGLLIKGRCLQARLNHFQGYCSYYMIAKSMCDVSRGTPWATEHVNVKSPSRSIWRPEFAERSQTAAILTIFLNRKQLPKDLFVISDTTNWFSMKGPRSKNFSSLLKLALWC